MGSVIVWIVLYVVLSAVAVSILIKLVKLGNEIDDVRRMIRDVSDRVYGFRTDVYRDFVRKTDLDLMRQLFKVEAEDDDLK